ncbi:MAG: class I SAM-dependent methyltransferase [Cyanobacteria bacterium P01_H01_bin.130]
MAGKTSGVSPELYDYLLSVSLREPTVLQELRRVSRDRPGSQMLIPPDQGQFLNLLLKLMGAKRILEVGTFVGYSTLWMALALPQDGEIIACDIDKESGAIAQDFWQRARVADRIDLRLAPALDTLEALIAQGAAGTFDLAFIDADKRNYGTYYEHCLTLVRPGGLVAIDNVLWSGRVTDAGITDKRTQAIRQFNQERLGDRRGDLSVLAVGDGLTLVRKA